MVKVKICGITNEEDMDFCSKLADAVGVIVEVPVNTPRKLDRKRARDILSTANPLTYRVAVVMPKSLEEALEIYEYVEPDALQLHGNESVELVEKLKNEVNTHVIKAVHVKGLESLKIAESYAEVCDAILLDTGYGSGKTHDWGISKAIVEKIKKPVILAGGLKPENVKSAILEVKPYGVDVSSGVEKEKGKKDFKKVLNFVKNAKCIEI